MTITTKVLTLLWPVASLLLGACGAPPTVGEELDPSAGALVAARGDGAIATKGAPTVSGGDVLFLPKKSQFCTDEYVAYVVYPMTICTPPIIGGGANAELARVAAPASSAVSAGASLAAQDSGFAASSTLSPFCHVSGGPWFADVKTTDSCIMGVPDHSVLSILSAPQPFSTFWDGDINSVPPPFNPNVSAFVGEGCACCPGFISCPDGRCLPFGFSCDNNGPPA